MRTNKAELKPHEKKDLHIFYWAAFFGLKKYVRLMLIKRRWSPFIKSYKDRSVLAGAICGRRPKVCRMILKEYEYQAVVPASAPWVKKDDQFKVFGKDVDDNNILHHCYVHDMPEVRQMLRDSNFVNIEQEKAAQNMVEERKKLKKGVKHRTLRMNRRG